MREKKVFGERTAAKEKREVRRKYLLLSEGSQTEPIYFSCLADNSSSLGISSLVQIVQLERSSFEIGLSNPKTLAKYLISKLNETDKTFIYGSLINAVMDVLNTFDIFLRWQGLSLMIENELKDYVSCELKKTLEDTIDIGLIKTTVMRAVIHLRNKFGYLSAMVIESGDIEASLNGQLITFDSEVDKICLVVDRDRKSFSTEQYDTVMKICREHNIKLFVSNPCFEFWLLLHVCNPNTLDIKKLQRNENIPGSEPKKTYSETELIKYVSNYKKSSFNPLGFINKIDNAIRNEKLKKKKLEELKNNVGTNIGTLIEEMRTFS